MFKALRASCGPLTPAGWGRGGGYNCILHTKHIIWGETDRGRGVTFTFVDKPAADKGFFLILP